MEDSSSLSGRSSSLTPSGSRASSFSVPSSFSRASFSSRQLTSSGVYCDGSTPSELIYSDEERSSTTRYSITSRNASDMWSAVPDSVPSTGSMNRVVMSQLEDELQNIQRAYLSLTSEYTRLKFKLRQILQAGPEDRPNMLEQLRPLVFSEDEENSRAAQVVQEAEVVEKAVVERQESRQEQFGLIQQLRDQLSTLATVSQKQYQLPSHLVEEHSKIQAAKEQMLKRINEKLMAKQAEAKAESDDDD